MRLDEVCLQGQPGQVSLPADESGGLHWQLRLLPGDRSTRCLHSERCQQALAADRAAQ